MNRKTILAFNIISTVALVSLIAFAPIVESHQAHAFWGGYYGGTPYGGTPYGGGFFPSFYPPAFYPPAMAEYGSNPYGAVPDFPPLPTGGTAARIQVIVPNPQAVVVFDGRKTSSTGKTRYFHTPALDPGSTRSKA